MGQTIVLRLASGAVSVSRKLSALITGSHNRSVAQPRRREAVENIGRAQQSLPAYYYLAPCSTGRYRKKKKKRSSDSSFCGRANFAAAIFHRAALSRVNYRLLLLCRSAISRNFRARYVRWPRVPAFPRYLRCLNVEFSRSVPGPFRRASLSKIPPRRGALSGQAKYLGTSPVAHVILHVLCARLQIKLNTGAQSLEKKCIAIAITNKRRKRASAILSTKVTKRINYARVNCTPYVSLPFSLCTHPRHRCAGSLTHCDTAISDR